MRATLLFSVLVAAQLTAHYEAATVNPIRKIVTLMQNMQKEIAAEGDKEKDLFDKFMCFCGGSSSDLEKAAADSRARIEEFSAKVKSETAEKTQLELDIAQHKKDREGAASDAAQATTLREKESSDYNDMAADSKTNIAAMAGALPALEAGMSGASLMQLPHRDRLHRLVETYPNVDSNDRRNVIAFLDQTGDYVPQSGQIVGILKQMKDEMEADLTQATTEEQSAVASFKQLTASKKEEGQLASRAIETKMARSGALAVAKQQSKDELEDEQEELADAEKFLGNLGEQCATKQKEWDARVAARNVEIAAISDAIKILSEDDALDSFKKALPSPSALQTGYRFLQQRHVHASPLQAARALLAGVVSHTSNVQFQLMLFTMNSKIKLQLGEEPAAPAGNATNATETPQSKGDALKLVAKIVDGMLVTLKKQQVDDDKQREWCMGEFTKAGDEEKLAKGTIADLEATVAELADGIQQLVDEIKPINEEIVALDRAVSEASEQRKEEHADYVDNIQMNSVAEKLLGKARNRLRKVYKPAQYVAPAAALLSMEEKILTAGTTLLQLSSSKVAPPQAPETFSGSVKKNAGSDGVLGMMDTIIQDLALASREAEMDENYAQKSYAKLMADSQQTRAEYSQVVTNKEAAKAKLAVKLESIKTAKTDANKDLGIVQGLLNDLHISCDYLMDNYDARKEARQGEMDSLLNSKTLVGGAQDKHAAAEGGGNQTEAGGEQTEASAEETF